MSEIETFGLSDIGLVRLNNEDVWAHLGQENFFILADGMGGHQAGEIAANETVLKLCHWIKRLKNFQNIETSLEEAIMETNLYVYNLSKEDKDLEGMGTTLCLALLLGKNLIHAHVGDSRLYRVRKSRLTRLTVDHSLKDELLASGLLEEDKAGSFPYKNILTRAVGTQPAVAPEIHTTEMQLGDLYFLCSDGLTDCLKDQEILKFIQNKQSVKEIVENLVEEAKKRGAPDNITILMFKIISF